MGVECRVGERGVHLEEGESFIGFLYERGFLKVIRLYV